MNTTLFQAPDWAVTEQQRRDYFLGQLLASHFKEVLLKEGVQPAARILRDLGVSLEDAHVILLRQEPR